MKENREYKSDVFSMLMEDKTNALEVYNALNESDYTDPEEVELVHLEKCSENLMTVNMRIQYCSWRWRRIKIYLKK